MTTPVWESMLFGGWAVLRTKKPIKSGALRRLDTASVSSSQFKVAAFCWLPARDESECPTLESRRLLPTPLEEEVPLDDWERSTLRTHTYSQHLLSAKLEHLYILRVITIQAQIEGDSFTPAMPVTTWRGAWDMVWYRLVMRAIGRFPCSEAPPEQNDDRWFSKWRSFAFRLQMQTLTCTSPVILPEEKHSFLATWLVLRRRLIAAHQQQWNASHKFPSGGRRFLYLLGLERLLETEHISGSIKAAQHPSFQESPHQITLWESEQ